MSVMEDNDTFRRFAGVSAILAGLLAIASGVFGAAALGSDPGMVTNPESLLQVGVRGAGLLRWSLLLDVFGYYLLLGPLAIYMWYWLKPASPPWVSLYTACGLAYILIGAMGAAILAAVLPPLIQAYGSASGPVREAVGILAISYANAVYQGLWNPLEMILGGAWWLGSGFLIRRRRPTLGIITLLVGTAAWLDAFSIIFNLEPLFLVALSAVLLLIPVWTLWFGIDLLKRPA